MSTRRALALFAVAMFATARCGGGTGATDAAVDGGLAGDAVDGTSADTEFGGGDVDGGLDGMPDAPPPDAPPIDGVLDGEGDAELSPDVGGDAIDGIDAVPDVGPPDVGPPDATDAADAADGMNVVDGGDTGDVGQASCDDDNPCTLDLDDGAGGCTHEPLDTAAACDDGDPCTTDDVCDQGACVGVPVDCDDGDPCTLDGCDEAGTCLHEPSCESGQALWSKRYGGMQADGVRTVAALPGGSVVIGGFAGADASFGTSPFQGQGGQDGFVAVVDVEGKIDLLVPVGGLGDDVVEAVATAGADRIALAGTMGGDLTVGDLTLTGAGLDDGFVGVVGLDGTVQWAAVVGDKNDDQALAVAGLPGGGVCVGGAFRFKITLAGTDWISQGEEDAYVVCFDDGGEPTWAAVLGTPGVEAVTALVVDAEGRITAGGRIGGSGKLGDVDLAASDAQDIFLAQFDADGNVLWAHAYGANGNDWIAAMAVDVDGRIAITGGFTSETNLGGDAFQGHNLTPDLYVACYDAAGTHLWSHAFGTGGKDVATGVTFGPAGSVLLTGQSTGALDLGGGAIKGDDKLSIWLARFDADGMHVWSEAFAGGGMGSVHRLATTDVGLVALAGMVVGDADFGLGTLVSFGKSDAYVVLVAP